MINITVWRKNYDRVYELSGYLRGRLSENATQSIKKEIANILLETSQYLDLMCNKQAKRQKRQ